MSEFDGEKLDKILSSGPPLNWYYGFGERGEGITLVMLGKNFSDIEDGRAKESMAVWFDQSHKVTVWTEKGGIPQEKISSAQSAITKAAADIKRMTGFTPEEIEAKCFALQDIFQGQSQAPFDFKLR